MDTGHISEGNKAQGSHRAAMIPQSMPQVPRIPRLATLGGAILGNMGEVSECSDLQRRAGPACDCFLGVFIENICFGKAVLSGPNVRIVNSTARLFSGH